MERKIGEIFEYNGEWYQCLPEILICVGCAFKKKTCEKIRGIRGECERASRQTYGVIFKKLEKVGEPYEYFVQHRGIVMLQPYKLFATPFINGVVCNVNYDTNTIDLEIKQTKEDMKENKTPLPKEDNALTRIVYAYVNGKISDNELINSIKEMSDEYPFKKNNLKPFSLEKAKQGKPVCTKDGRKARIICFDRNDLYPIVALIECKDGKEIVGAYSNEGKTEIYEIKGTDLMMLAEKKEGWVNVYYDNEASSHRGCRYIYNTKEQAVKEASSNCITTIKIEWEE